MNLAELDMDAEAASPTRTALIRTAITERLHAIEAENASLREQIAQLDTRRAQLAVLSQQQQGAHTALTDLLAALDKD